MMPIEEEPEQRPSLLSDRRLWQRCRTIDAPEDEATRFLDLAAFVDGRLDAEDHDRIAALLADDPGAAADVQAAQALGAADRSPAGLERVIARACAILEEPEPFQNKVVPLHRREGRPAVQILAQWGSLAAAVAFAGWLGFAMGSNTSLALSTPRQPSDAGSLHELFDPSIGFLRDLGEGLRT